MEKHIRLESLSQKITSRVAIFMPLPFANVSCASVALLQVWKNLSRRNHRISQGWASLLCFKLHINFLKRIVSRRGSASLLGFGMDGLKSWSVQLVHSFVQKIPGRYMLQHSNIWHRYISPHKETFNIAGLKTYVYMLIQTKRINVVRLLESVLFSVCFFLTVSLPSLFFRGYDRWDYK